MSHSIDLRRRGKPTARTSGSGGRAAQQRAAGSFRPETFELTRQTSLAAFAKCQRLDEFKCCVGVQRGAPVPW